jgi:hypothetical protein
MPKESLGKQLEEEESAWRKLTATVGQVLEMAEG